MPDHEELSFPFKMRRRIPRIARHNHHYYMLFWVGNCPEGGVHIATLTVIVQTPGWGSPHLGVFRLGLGDQFREAGHIGSLW